MEERAQRNTELKKLFKENHAKNVKFSQSSQSILFMISTLCDLGVFSLQSLREKRLKFKQSLNQSFHFNLTKLLDRLSKTLNSHFYLLNRRVGVI